MADEDKKDPYVEAIKARPLVIEVTRSEVKSTKPYNFLKFYLALHEWFYEQGYAKDYDGDFPEKYYWESRHQTNGSEYWIWWRGYKEIEGNKLFKRVIDLDIHGVGVKNEEIMYDGKRIKVNNGKFELLIRGKIEIDEGAKWRNSHIWIFISHLLEKAVEKDLEMIRRDVQEDSLKLHDFTRDFMGLPTVKRRPHLFQQRYGYEEDN